MRTSIVAGVICCNVPGLSAAAEANTAIRRLTSIPPQSLEPALQALAKEHDLQVVYRSDVVGDRRTHGAAGELTTTEAFQQLLRDTGLQVEYIDERTVTIVPAQASAAPTISASAGTVSAVLAQDAKRRNHGRMGIGAFFATLAATFSASGQEAVGPAGQAELEEIIVTAQKRQERLQDVPISIAVLDGDVVERAAVTRVNDLGELVPNVAFESAYGAAQESRLTIRGITGNVRNAGFESGLGVYVDGAYAGRPAGQNLDLTDVERVEVLRGPQGTLFGKNTIAGVINVVTKKPGEELDGRIIANVGNFNKRSFSGHVSGPIVDDSLFAGGSFFSNERDGYVKNFYDGGELGSEDNYGGALKLRYVASNGLELNVRADYLKDDHLFLYPEPFDGTSTIGDGIVYSPGIRTVNFDGIPREEREVYGTALTLDYDVGDHTFTSISAYNRSEFRHFEDNDDSPLPSLLVDGWHDVSKFASQEFRLASPTTAKFDYIFGAYLFWQSVVSDVPFRLGEAFPGGPGLSNVYADVESTGGALFAHTNYHFTDALTLTVGLRYTLDRKKVKDYRATSVGPFDGVFDFPSFTDRREDSDLSPMVSLSYAWSDDATTYVKVARGFKSGGWNTDYVVAGPNGTPPPASTLDFDPEYATTYEVGFKGSLFDRHLQLNVAAFHTDYEDLQVQSRIFDPATNLFLFEFNNAATSTIDGAEVEAALQVTEGLSLRAGLGYTDAVYDSFKGASVVNGQPIDYDDNRLPHAPSWNSSLMLTYEHALSPDKTLSISVDHAYKDSFFTDAANDPDLEVGSRSVIGCRVGLASAKGWEVFLWGENLADEDYLITKQKGTGNVLRVTWGMPRSYGVQLGYKF